MRVAIVVLLCVCALAGRGRSAEFALETGYFSLSGKDGVIASMRFDPMGKGRYGRNHIVGLTVGDPIPNPDVRAEADLNAGRLTLHGLKTAHPVRIEHEAHDHAELLTPGHTIGQTFRWERGLLTAAEALLPTWGTTDSELTVTLYRVQGDDRARVASRRAEKMKDNSWVRLDVPNGQPGEYLLEITDVKGMAGWWSDGSNVIPGQALADGKPVPNVDRCIRCIGYEPAAGDLEIKAESSKLSVGFRPGPGAPQSAPPCRLTIPWEKSGYDTTSDRIIFHHFLTNRGLYMPVHQFKRRPHSGVGGEWVLMSGRFGTDLRFTNANIHLEMADDAMAMTFPGGTWAVEALPHTEQLSEQFPQFELPDRRLQKVLNEFLLSHNFNFGVGTNPDWKDWHTLQLSWTANGQCDWQRRQFLDFKIGADGYVYCWGGDPGWPFPYKDENKDGVNDFDTRHFTTNPCYILGAWREYCWKPDPEYLAKLMPRVRLAMEFMLNEMEGDGGILTSRSPDHTGKDGSIGSNYWDITPFGFKDAFTNAHYYPCLEAMAQLEEAALHNADCGLRNAESVRARTPRYYRRLAENAWKSYNETFWLNDRGRYSACVDVDGITHDYGCTFVNLPAMAYGLADPAQVKRIYEWMEKGVTSSGKADTYSRWTIAPRACTIHNPMRSEPQTPVPSWWSMSWGGTAYDDQCQDGGAILYTSFHDILARAKYLGADNAWRRLVEILDRYSKPDHLSGGSPLYYGETTQGGPGGTAGSVGVEGEFPESGLVPVSFFYAFLGIDADIHGLRIRPNLPSGVSFGGVTNVRFAGRMYDIRVTNTSVELKCTTRGSERVIRKTLAPGEVFKLSAISHQSHD